MKYIVIKTPEGEEQIFLFPASINHDFMFEAIRHIKSGHPLDWRRKLVGAEAVSAGFVDLKGNCWGNSETLSLQSRPAIDTKLLGMVEYANQARK